MSLTSYRAAPSRDFYQSYSEDNVSLHPKAEGVKENSVFFSYLLCFSG